MVLWSITVIFILPVHELCWCLTFSHVIIYQKKEERTLTDNYSAVNETSMRVCHVESSCRWHKHVYCIIICWFHKIYLLYHYFVCAVSICHCINVAAHTIMNIEERSCRLNILIGLVVSSSDKMLCPQYITRRVTLRYDQLCYSFRNVKATQKWYHRYFN